MASTVMLQSEMLSLSQRHRDALAEHNIPSGIASRRSTLWGPEATEEASKRLGWTSDPLLMLPLVDEVEKLRERFAARGMTHFVLCGMGGSSLAPEVICARDKVSLTILDSTHADQVRGAFPEDVSSTVVIVASKSGTTIETATTRAYFEERCRQAGLDPREHIVIVTDPGSPLDRETRERGYTVFNADPEVGGRFSALTAFGLVPSTLAGADTRSLLHEASTLWSQLAEDSLENPAVMLAGALSVHGRGHAVLSPASHLPGLGDWIEQLVAESTGKDGVGVLPVVVGKSTAPEVIHRVPDCVVIDLGNEAASWDVRVSATLGAHFLLWEWATAMVGYLLGINPFDQPDVESAKEAARGLLDARPDDLTPDLVIDGIEVYAQNVDLSEVDSLARVWSTIAGLVGSEGYLAVHLYVDRSRESEGARFRDLLATALHRPVTLGYGPRFLHSTGQFHKGGRPSGVFLQVSVPAESDLEIPGYPFTFSQLITAQQAGDRAVLASRGYPVVALRLANTEQWRSVVRSAEDEG